MPVSYASKIIVKLTPGVKVIKNSAHFTPLSDVSVIFTEVTDDSGGITLRSVL
jgi:hypothetical protein